ncbi:hypothetical protein D3C80_1315910 [compost metagenome]
MKASKHQNSIKNKVLKQTQEAMPRHLWRAAGVPLGRHRLAWRGVVLGRISFRANRVGDSSIAGSLRDNPYLIQLGEETFASVLLTLPAYSKSEKLIWLMGGSDQV